MASPRPQRLRVPASTSNVGPGFDAFSIALDLDLEVRWTPADKLSLERSGALAESELRMGQDPTVRGMRRAATLAAVDLPSGHLQISAPFPPGRGLGASGAGLVAGLMLGNRLTGNQLSDQILLDEAIQLEGNPENAVGATMAGAHWSIANGQDQWIHMPVHLHRNLRLLLVIPPYAMPTKRSREALPTSVSFQRAMRQAHRPPILLEGLRSLNPDFIRLGIEDDLHVAPRLKLMTGASAMIDFAYEAGALGATLSGAGSALLILSRTGEVSNLETRLRSRAQRLWGDDGIVMAVKTTNRGAQFLRP
jgi:homoserine kinase